MKGIRAFLVTIEPILPYIFGAGVILIGGYFLWGKTADALGIGDSAANQASSAAGAAGQASGYYATTTNPNGGGLLGGPTPSLDGTYSQAAAQTFFHPWDTAKVIFNF